MILLVTPSERAFECATALTESTGERVVVAENLAAGNHLVASRVLSRRSARSICARSRTLSGRDHD